MTAPWPEKLAAALVKDAENQILIAEARAFIVNQWLAGWIVGDDAMECLVKLGLIEFDARLLAESEAA